MHILRFVGILGLGGVLVASGCETSSSEQCNVLPGTSTSSSSGSMDPACSAVVVVGLYGDDQCAAGTEVLTVTFPIAEACVGWSRISGSDTVYNSASRFQCFRDRLCYTQYVHSCACSADAAQRVEDKDSRTTCAKDPTPGIWTRILSGTENCPDVPAGFACPTGEGNPEIKAACGM